MDGRVRVRPYVRRMTLDRERVPDFSRYPFCIPAVSSLHTLAFHEKVTFFIGENGMGKSTLMEALAVACGCCPEGGGRNFRLSTRDTHSSLHRCLRLEKGPLPPRDNYFLRAESFYNVATYLEDLDALPASAPPLAEAYGGPLHAQSHGESFFALLNERLGGEGLYLFDEPEAALSPMRQMAMLTSMHRLTQAGSQLIIATHSPILMAYPESVIYLLDDGGIRQVSYEETDHYRVTRDFLNRYPALLRILLEEPEESGFGRKDTT